MERKLRLAAVLFFLCLPFITGFLPEMILNRIQTAEVIRPEKVSFTPYITCTGRLKAGKSETVYAHSPTLLQEICVQPGEWANEGQMIASVDAVQTDALKHSSAGIPDPALVEQYRSIAKQYGMEEELEQYAGFQSAGIPAEDPDPTEPELLSPCDGMVTEVADTGVLLPAGAVLFSISEELCHTAVLQLMESDLPAITEGAQVLLTGPGLGNREYHGIITTLAPAAEQAMEGLSKVTFVEAKTEILDPDEFLRPGLSLTARIITGKSTKALAVPYSAVDQDESNREFVYQVSGGKIQKRYITVCRELARCVQAYGISEDEPVLAEAGGVDPDRQYRIFCREAE